MSFFKVWCSTPSPTPYAVNTEGLELIFDRTLNTFAN